MPFELQTRLLRVLSDGHFYRVGGQDPIKANVRIIASTHQNLEARVAAGAFREDLLHRLNVIRLRMPALRERGSDVTEIAQAFLVAESTMAARITRAKKKIVAARIPFRLPMPDELPARLDAALA